MCSYQQHDAALQQQATPLSVGGYNGTFNTIGIAQRGMHAVDPDGAALNNQALIDRLKMSGDLAAAPHGQPYINACPPGGAGFAATPKPNGDYS